MARSAQDLSCTVPSTPATPSNTSPSSSPSPSAAQVPAPLPATATPSTAVPATTPVTAANSKPKVGHTCTSAKHKQHTHSPSHRDPKNCDCCFCEMFGHGAVSSLYLKKIKNSRPSALVCYRGSDFPQPPAAPTSHRFHENRQRLRSKLNKSRASKQQAAVAAKNAQARQASAAVKTAPAGAVAPAAVAPAKNAAAAAPTPLRAQAPAPAAAMGSMSGARTVAASTALPAVAATKAAAAAAAAGPAKAVAGPPRPTTVGAPAPTPTPAAASSKAGPTLVVKTAVPAAPASGTLIVPKHQPVASMVATRVHGGAVRIVPAPQTMPLGSQPLTGAAAARALAYSLAVGSTSSTPATSQTGCKSTCSGPESCSPCLVGLYRPVPVKPDLKHTGTVILGSKAAQTAGVAGAVGAPKGARVPKAVAVAEAMRNAKSNFASPFNAPVNITTFAPPAAGSSQTAFTGTVERKKKTVVVASSAPDAKGIRPSHVAAAKLAEAGIGRTKTQPQVQTQVQTQVQAQSQPHSHAQMQPQPSTSVKVTVTSNNQRATTSAAPAAKGWTII